MDPLRSRVVRGRVLVVDDEPLVGHALRKVLGREYDVTVRTSAREALDQLERGEHFDVIFCDVTMPSMTGLGFHEALEQISPALAARVVFVTGSASEATCDLFGVVPNMVLSKPFDAHLIRDVARQFVAARPDVVAEV